MPPSYETLHLFSSRQGHLLEIKRRDQAPDANRSRTHLWLWVTDSSVSLLKFRGMETGCTQTRLSREARLSFDAQRGEFAWHGGDVVALTNEPHKQPDVLRRRLIREHLS